MIKSPVSEIFYSFQGEGPLLGIPFLFVRFSGCNLRCSYCDTKYSWKIQQNAEIYYRNRSVKKEALMSSQEIIEIIKSFHIRRISLTGGEPMIYSDMLEAIEKQMKDHFFLIETNGTLPKKLSPDLIHLTDQWSVDIKLPSVSGFEQWDVTREFLKRIQKANSYVVKIVFSEETGYDELKVAYSMFENLYEKNENGYCIFQPLTVDNRSKLGDNIKWIEQWSEKSDNKVRLVPQIHKFLEIQ